MNRSPSGRGLILIAVALATAVLWISLGVREGLEAEIRALADRIGANLFYVHAEADFGEDDLARLANLAEVAGVAGEGTYSTGYLPGQTYNITRLEVSSNYLNVFQLPLAAGRSFTPQDKAVVILGWEVKEAIFGEANPVGQTLDGAEIIGVLAQIPSDDELRRRLNNWVLVPAGSGPKPFAQAGSSERPYGALLVRARGNTRRAQSAVMRALPGATTTQISKRYQMYFHTERTTNRLLVISSLVMLVLAGTVVAGLLSLSVMNRSWEIGVRRTVGATTQDILRLFLVEGVWLAGAGGIAGICLGELVLFLVPSIGDSASIGAVHALVLPLTLTVGLLASLHPSWQAARISPARALSLRTLEGRRRYGIGGGRLIAALAVIIASSGLFLLINLVESSQESLTSLWGSIDERTFLVQSPRQSILAAPDLSARDLPSLQVLPGVEAAVVSGSRPVRIDGTNSPVITVEGVGNGWEDLGLLNIEQGRDLSASEIEEGEKVALVAKGVASTMFKEVDPIGQRLNIRNTLYTVVGVFNDNIALWTLGAQVIVPYKCFEGSWFDHSFFIYTSSEAKPGEVRAAIVDLFQGIYPDKAKVEIVAPAVQVAEWRQTLTATASRLGILVGLGLLLGAIGVFNLVSFLLLLRTRELGIRRAVGATSNRIVTLGVVEALKITVPAGLIGLSLGLAGTGPLQRFLGQPPSLSWNWAWIIVATAIGVGLLAGGWPAWRVSRLSPAEVMRRGKR